MILMNVSEFDNVNDATDTLISAIQAFKDEDMNVGEFSMDIIDVFNQIGNSYAISTSDLADSLTRSSASLVAANNSLEQAVALTTAANTTVQNPETVGTTLKTLSMRIRGVKTELEEAGEDTEGMITNTSKLQAKVQALTNVDGKGGINILTNTGEFKSTYDILLEISKVWKEMGDMDQAALLEIIAGKRAGSVVAGILQNGDVLENAYKDALGADGSAMQELATYLDSIQGKIDQFNNSTQTMWMNFMNSEVVKFFVDLATSVIKAADNVGLLQIAVAAFFAKTAFNADSFGQLFKLDVNEETGQIEHFGFSLSRAARNAQGMSIATRAAAIGTQLLNSALSMGIALLASWVISAFIGWLDETIVTADELKEKVTELTDTYKNAKKEFSENLDDLTISSDPGKYATLADEFEELAKGVNAYGENISLTSDEYERYKSICEDIVGVNPSIAEGYDSATKAIGNNAGALKQLIELQKEQARLASAEYVSYGAYAQNGNFENIAKNAINEFNDAYKATGKYINGEQSIVDKLSDLIWPDYFEITDYGIAETSADDFAQSIMRAIGYNPDKINEILASYSSDELGFELDLWASDYTSEIVKNREKISKELKNMDVDYLAGETFQSQKTFIEKVLKDAKYTKKQISNAMQEYHTDDGTFDFDAFKLGIADVENGVTYGDILATYVENHVESALDVWSELADGYEDVDKTLQSVQNSMLDTFLQVPYALREYEELSTSEQSFITDWIKNSQMFKIDESTTQDTINAAKQTIINMVRAIAGEDYKASIKDQNGNVINVGLDVVLDTMANIDVSKGTYSKYKADIEENLNALWSAIEKDAAKFGFENKRDLAVQLGYELAFEEEVEDDNTDKFVARIAELTGESEEGIREYMNGLPPIKVTRAIEYYLAGNYDGVQGNTDENQFTVDDAFNLPSPSAVSVDISTVETYTKLSEKASTYNDILAQTNEITADHMEVTQEYKDSLSELGFTEEELSECFDKNNDLVVKNSELLRKLVAEKKKAAAADVKLAKSQSRLEYYDLVNQLNKTLSATDLLDDKNRAIINSTLEQLNVVEQAIYKYQLLEDSLLGTTNAFEEFAKAQEVDELNTYGDSYVEMVQTMYDGLYKTGEVGTESFWSAVEHLIPEEVYQGLTEDADRMKAIYEYFNKNIAPTLTLKEDEFSMDYDAVENFVEKAIKLGVFNKDGTTGKFNLVEGMNLERAADLMGMTTAQAYAFFAELDKYNVSGNEHSFLMQLDDSTEGQIMLATAELENLNKQKLALLEDGGYAKHGEELAAINEKIKTQNAELDKLGVKSYQAWQNYAKTDSAISALNEIEDKTTKLTRQQAIELGVEWEENMTVEDALKQLEERKANLEEPTVLTAQIAQEHVQDELADLEKELGKERFITIKAKVEQDENGVWKVVQNNGLSAEDQAFAQKYANLLNANQDIANFLETGLTTTETYLSSIDSTLQAILGRISGKENPPSDNQKQGFLGQMRDWLEKAFTGGGGNAGGDGAAGGIPGDGNGLPVEAPPELTSGTDEYNAIAQKIADGIRVPVSLLYKNGATLDAFDYSETGGSTLIPGQGYVDPFSMPGGKATMVDMSDGIGNGLLQIFDKYFPNFKDGDMLLPGGKYDFDLIDLAQELAPYIANGQDLDNTELAQLYSDLEMYNYDGWQALLDAYYADKDTKSKRGNDITRKPKPTSDDNDGQDVADSSGADSKASDRVPLTYITLAAPPVNPSDTDNDADNVNGLQQIFAKYFGDYPTNASYYAPGLYDGSHSMQGLLNDLAPYLADNPDATIDQLLEAYEALGLYTEEGWKAFIASFEKSENHKDNPNGESNPTDDVANQLAAVTAELANSQAKLADTQAKLADTETQLTDTQTELTNTQADLTNSQAELTSTQAALADTQAQLADTEAQLSQSQSDFDQASAALNATKAQLAQTESMLSETQTELASVETQLTDTQAELANTQADLTESQTALADTTAALENTQNELTDTQNDLADAQATLEASEDKLANTEAALLESQNALAEAENRAEIAEGELNETSVTLLHVQTALVASEAGLATANEALINANNALTQTKDELGKTQGALDTANAKLAEYEAALGETQTALANSEATLAATQATLDAANANIEALSAEKAALANALSEKESQLTSLNEQLSAAQLNLAESNAQVESLSADKAGLESQVADLTSQLESVTASLAEAQGNLETAKSDIELLAQDKAALETSMAAMTQELESVKSALDSANAAKETADAAINALNEEKAKLETALANASAQLDDVNAALQATQRDLEATTSAKEAAEATVTSLNEQKANLEAAVTEMEAKLEEINGDLNNLQAAKDAADAAIKTLTEEKTALENQVSSLTQTNANLDEQITSLNEQISASEATLADANGKVAALSEENTSLSQQIADLNAQLSDSNTELTAMNKEAAALREENAALTEKVAALEAEATEQINEPYDFTQDFNFSEAESDEDASPKGSDNDTNATNGQGGGDYSQYAADILAAANRDMVVDVDVNTKEAEEEIEGLADDVVIPIIPPDVDPLGLNSSNLSIESLKVSLRNLGVLYEDTIGTWFDGKRELAINVPQLVEALKAKGWTETAIGAYLGKLTSVNIADYLINTNIDDVSLINLLIEQWFGVPEDRITNYEVTGDDEDTVDGINAAWGDVPDKKTTHYTIYKTTVEKTKRSGSIWDLFGFAGANGTAHAQGTAYKGGSWGAEKTETALVGELGPELRVRGNKWELLGERGAEFRDVRKNDIIFNHKQTEQLLTNGYITGRGKAFAEGTVGGTAYSGLWKPTSPDSSLSNTAGTELSAAAGKLSDAADDVKEVFDWIEVRLEEINERISLKNAKLENTVGFAKQNAIIDDMIALNQALYDNLTAGASKYYAYAAKLLEKVPAEYRKAAQDGSIAIEEFVGETDEKTLKAIQDYREWVQKGADATQQAEETLTEISNLAKQAIDNIAQEYENKLSLPQAMIEQLEAYNALIETTQGAESAKIYKAMIQENNKQIGILTEQRKKMQAELNAQVEAGNIKKYSQAWYEAVGEIAAVDTEIINLTADTYDYQDAINELHWEHFDNLMGRFEAISDEAENLIDILSNKDLVDKDTAEWTNEGITSLGLYAQQMEVAEMQAKKYKEEIQYLNKNWKELGYTEQEYLEKLEELKSGQYDSIKAYNDTKKAIVDLAKERVDAIKEGIEKEIEAYEELISKKKEELDAEKDLYGFQKGIAKQQKTIADIERKLAALSSDNSASARAKRAQLEAELAEARQELEDTYYDRSVSNQSEALDKELEAFQEEKDKEMEGWDEYLENTEQVVADGLATIQDNTDAVYNTLQEMGEEYSLSIADALTSPWVAGEDAIQDYSEKFKLSTSETIKELREIAKEHQELIDEIELHGGKDVGKVTDNMETYVDAEKNAAGTTGGANSSVVGMVSNLSGNIQYGQSGSNVKKLQQALNALGFNCGSADGIFGDKTYAAVMAFQRSSKFGGTISADGIVGTNTKKKFKVAGYASGTTGVKKDQIAVIDELGEELVIRPSKGRMTFMEKGTDVIPADLTANLMGWANLDPSIMLERNKPVISAPHVVNNNIEINMSFGEVVHIDTVTNDTIPNLTKAIEKQMDKYMKGVNNNIRKYAR